MPNKIRPRICGCERKLDLGLSVALPSATGQSGCRVYRSLHHPARERGRGSQAFGAKLAFHDFRAMVVSPRSMRWPWLCGCHRTMRATKAAIEAGKHVYTEWPLGRNTAEAEELATLARDKGVQTAVGLQSRVSPALLYIKEQMRPAMWARCSRAM